MSETDLEQIDIMGIPLTVLNSYEQAVSRILDSIGRKQNVSCVAINPEKIYRARRDKELRMFIQSADYCICDGVGVAMAVRLLFRRKIPRITGIQLFFELAAGAETRKFRIFLLGGSPESNEGASHKLKQMHKKLVIAGRHHGYFTDEEEVIAQINKSRADMLFVALGSPRQEKWIAQYRDRLKVPYCMGVGGSLDVLSGKTPRAPHLFRKTGTEWIYRLAREPSRVQRQAFLPIFALSVIRHYFYMKVRSVSSRSRGIPFDVKIPNELTAKTLTDSEKGIDLHRASSVDDLFEELDSCPDRSVQERLQASRETGEGS